MKSEDNVDRLFIPLSSDPYSWFQSGLKKWELRKYGRQYTEKNVYIGRQVELRRGYSDRTHALWGKIELIERADSLSAFFDKVDFREVVPLALSQDDAESQIEKILNIRRNQSLLMIGFKMKIDNDFLPTYREDIGGE